MVAGIPICILLSNISHILTLFLQPTVNLWLREKLAPCKVVSASSIQKYLIKKIDEHPIVLDEIKGRKLTVHTFVSSIIQYV